MAQPRSDNRKENHPKPVQEGERKLVGGVYVDYTDIADIIANTTEAFRPNKYFWAAGVKYHFTTAIDYRVVGGAGGAGIKSLKFAINTDGSGVPDSTFDGYKAAGNLLSDARLENVKIIAILAAGSVFQDFFPGSFNHVPYNSVTGLGTLDFTSVGGLSDPSFVIILFQPL